MGEGDRGERYVISGSGDAWDVSVRLPDGTTTVLASGIAGNKAYRVCVRHYHGPLESLSWGGSARAVDPECFEQVVVSNTRRTLQRNAHEQRKCCLRAPLDLLLGLDFCSVLRDAICDERRLARRLSRVGRRSSRHRLSPAVDLRCEVLPELPSVAGVGRGDDLARVG